MRTSTIIATITLLAAAGAAPAALAQYSGQYRGGYGNGAYTVRCESHDGRRTYCRTNGNGRVELVRQLSRSSCIAGRTWGTDRSGIWVDGGCRADFAVQAAGYGYGNDRYRNDRYRNDRYGNQGYGYGYGSSGRTVRCESEGSRRQVCNVDTRGGVQLVRQLSRNACVAGRTWGVDNTGIWVNNGCRAEFAINSGRGYGNAGGYPSGHYGQRIRCESQGDRYTDCRVPGNVRRVELARTLSRSQCVEGRTWGFRNGQIWVDRGCRAEFNLY